MADIDRWQKLKIWVGKRHDYLEATYKQTNFSADAAELGAFRSVFMAMKDIEEQEAMVKAFPSMQPAGRAAR